MAFGSIAPLRLIVSANYTKNLTTKTLNSRSDFEYIKTSIESGTTVGKADLIYEARRTVASAGVPDTFDLSGSLTDPFGDACVFAEVTGIFLWNRDASNNLTLGAGSNPFITWLKATGDGVVIGPDGFFALYNPAAAAYAVTADTGDILTVTASGGTTVPYDVMIVGRSA
jgi:hypothetical protein